jgi:hypothetical protein
MAKKIIPGKIPGIHHAMPRPGWPRHDTPSRAPSCLTNPGLGSTRLEMAIIHIGNWKSMPFTIICQHGLSTSAARKFVAINSRR